MTRHRAVLAAITAGLIVLLALFVWRGTVDSTNGTSTTTSGPATTSASAGPWQIARLTENRVNDMVPWVNGHRLAWRAYDGEDTEIVIADLADGSLEQLTDNSIPDYEPRMAGDYLVWQDGPTEAWQLHVVDLKSGQKRDLGAVRWYGVYRIVGDLLVWPEYSTPKAVVKAHHLPSAETRTIDVGEQAEVWPTTDGLQVGVYAADADGLGSVHLYDWRDDTLTTLSEQIPGLTWGTWTEDNWLADGRVVWAAREEGDLEIYRYEGADSSTTKLTDNDVDDFAPVIGGSTVLWYQAEDAGVPGGLSGEPIPSPERTVRLRDLESGEERTLEGAFAWLQADGRLAATAAWPQRWAEMHVYDLERGSVERMSQEGYTGSWIHLDEGRVTWYREEEAGTYPTAEVMLAYRGEAPRLPADAEPAGAVGTEP